MRCLPQRARTRSRAAPGAAARGGDPQALAQWRAWAQQCLAERGEHGGGGRQDMLHRRRIRGLERELQRKERALAETAELLVLSKKYRAG